MCRQDGSITSDDQIDTLALRMVELPELIPTIFEAHPCPSDGIDWYVLGNIMTMIAHTVGRQRLVP
jgi:hypothetical protein